MRAVKRAGGYRMEHFVVTITRQFGSHGLPIARQMSEILGIDNYDRK